MKIELFFFKKIKKTINNELNLFKNVKIYSIFNILFLKSIDFNIFIQNIFYYTTKKTSLKSKKIYKNEINNILLNEKNTLHRETHKNFSNMWKIVENCKNF